MSLSAAKEIGWQQVVLVGCKSRTQQEEITVFAAADRRQPVEGRQLLPVHLTDMFGDGTEIVPGQPQVAYQL